ncbi:MAG: flavodoxin [Chloroflexi bacterium]|nr:flavodoxin [Chloroflexota bacterium]
MTRVLVAYASRHNSTAEIAFAIGGVLQQSPQLQVDIEQVDHVKDITPYQVVVLGSAIYMGQWQAAAADFLKQRQRELEQRSVWLFSSGPIGDGDPKTLMNGWVFPEVLQPFADRIKPRDIALFHGKLERDWLNILEKAAVKFVGASTGDSRDWKMIRAWANKIAEALIPV